MVLELLLLLDMITVVRCPGIKLPHECTRSLDGELSIVEYKAMNV